MKDQLSAFQKPRKHGERLLEKSVDLAEAARIHGNYPFGAVLRYSGTEDLGGENSVNTSRDTTAHAEIEVIRSASPTLTKEQLSRSTIYTSTEPCAMCSGAIYTAGIRRGIFRCWEKRCVPTRRCRYEEPDASNGQPHRFCNRAGAGRRHRPAPGRNTAAFQGDAAPH